MKINLSNVTLKYEKSNFNSLENISLQIEEGDFIGLIGPNGAGKTSMIKVICGLLKPSAFESVQIDSIDVYQRNNFSEITSKIGLILGSDQLYDDLTGYENIKFYLKLKKIKFNKNRVDEILKRVGLVGRANDFVKTYSLGMKQKLNVARVVLGECSILILDEPTSGLDPISKLEVYQILKEINQVYKLTILLSSHVMEDVEKVCDKAILINNGSIIIYETIEVVFSGYPKNVTEIEMISTKAADLEEKLISNNYQYYIKRGERIDLIVVFSEIGNELQLLINDSEKIILRTLSLQDIFFFHVLKERFLYG